ncbi:glycerol-3-phosphate acyltransferase [Candidatus Pelagibacter sp.]|nr:glycerol-3-phosphate acyltransferase [Candidatus Pelagibacter sp.]
MDIFLIGIISYLMGSIPFGFILTKIFLKKDIREIGSGNIGATNALDKNEETNKIALDFFRKANQEHKIQTIIKPALESLKKLKNDKFDMIFIDADKMNYKEYYERSLELLNKGGLIIVDNVLWHGEVADEKNNDKFTLNIREFNKFVSEDKRVEQIIIPLGDGMTVCRVL